VLPFANMTTSEETGFLSDGLAEDILDNLAQFEGSSSRTALKVASRSASFQFTGRGVDPTLVRETLNVAYLLEGSVRQHGEEVRITTQLIRTADGFHVWSKSYDRALADGFGMQSAVAANIAHITNAKLDFDIFRNYGWKQEEIFTGIDPIAVGYFIRATEEIINMLLGEGGDARIRIQFSENAVEVDPDFLAAYAILASAYLTSYTTGRLSVHEASRGAHTAITRAIALDPDDIEVRNQLAQIQLAMDLDLAQAKNGFEQMLKMAPEFGISHVMLAMIDLQEGRARKALNRISNTSEFHNGGQRAIFLSMVAYVRLIARDYEGALKASAEALELALEGQGRTRTLINQAVSLIMLGKVDEAKPFVEEAWSMNGSTNPEGYVSLFAGIGDIEKARSILTDPRYDLNQSRLAAGHLALGDVDSAFDSMRAGIENRDGGLIFSLRLAAWWDPIRDDPRFNEMLALLDAKVTHTEQYRKDHKISPAAQ
jgi:TolB-like protein